jgi:hypothetical protein
MRQAIRVTASRFAVILFGLSLLFALPRVAQAQCPGNLLINPSFEAGKYKGEVLGTSLSSWLSVDWAPWAILGDQQINREIEFFVVDGQTLQEGYYRVHEGRLAQKFFSGYSTHHAGFYQRRPVTRGQQVTFSIWVQIATGQEEFWSWGLPISDLGAPGNYRVWAGIDPYGGTPVGFGALPPASTVWSPEVIDRQTRMVTADGHEYDGWVQLTVSTIAQSDYVTVYTKGQPEFPVKNNSSFWDDACLVVSAPPAPTARPTNTPTETPSVTNTPAATNTPPATSTPLATATAFPTITAQPTRTATAAPTALPTSTSAPTTVPTASPSEVPSATPVPAMPTTAPTAVTAATTVPEATSGGTSNGLLIGGVAVGAALAGYAVARLRRRR